MLLFVLAMSLVFAYQTKEKPKEALQETPKSTNVDNEWQSLFDGKTKNGWHVYHNKSDGSA